MNIIVLLICGLFNIFFLICGYKLGSKKELITIQKGDTVSKIKTDYVDFDEEASYLTPEEEIEFNKAYEKAMKQGDTSGF